jgi:hypothetical protein
MENCILVQVRFLRPATHCIKTGMGGGPGFTGDTPSSSGELPRWRGRVSSWLALAALMERLLLLVLLLLSLHLGLALIGARIGGVRITGF